MKLRYLGGINLTSNNISFTPKMEIVEVKQEIGNYLISTFKGLFEEIVEVKEVVKQEVKQEIKAKVQKSTEDK